MNGKEFSRKTADKKIKELAKRAEYISHEADDFPYMVDRLWVFGSYLNTTKEKIGDLDIAYRILSKWDKDHQKDKEKECIEAEYENPLGGRRFKSILEEIFWPQTKTLKALKNHSKIISLHDEREIRKLKPVPEMKEIYAMCPDELYEEWGEEKSVFDYERYDYVINLESARA